MPQTVVFGCLHGARLTTKTDRLPHAGEKSSRLVFIAIVVQAAAQEKHSCLCGFSQLGNQNHTGRNACATTSERRPSTEYVTVFMKRCTNDRVLSKNLRFLRFNNSGGLRECVFELFVGGIKVRRDTNARLWTVVDQDFAAA